VNGANAVEVEEVRKRFGTINALDGITLAIPAGEVYGLLGPNGAGKTTLIRSLIGLVRPDSGTVRVLGHEMPDVAVLNRIGYMTQSAAVYPELSVEENVLFFARVNGDVGGVEKTLRTLQLWDRRKDVVATLSGGTRGRVSLACALVHSPALLLLDEPTVGIDPQLRVQFWEHFHKLADEGAAVIVTSHVMDEAERCDRLGLVARGRLLAEGTAAQLTKRARARNLEAAFLRLAAAESPE